MTVEVSKIALLEVKTNVGVDAEIRDAIEEAQLMDWEAEWYPFLFDHIRQLHRRGVPRSGWPQNSHWNWRHKTAAASGLLASRGFSVICGGMTQGLMLLNLTKTCHLNTQNGKPLVYVEYLEAAPWNRPEILSPPRFRGVGTALIIAAIVFSQQEGFKGRIGLHSLPQADRFYRETCGMSDLGPDMNYKGNLRYFEMTPAQAEALLK